MMSKKEINTALTAVTCLCLVFAVIILQNGLNQKDLTEADGTAWETVSVIEKEPASELSGYAKIWTDEEKTSYYQDMKTGYIHKATASGHIETLPMMDKGGNYLTYEMWADLHPDWHY